MKKQWISILLAVTMLLCLVGCGKKSPDGIGYVGDKPFYTIIMTDAERDTYFTTIGAGGKIAVGDTRNPGQINVVNWSAVEGGGWIAWAGGRVRYIPEGFSDTARTTACSTLNYNSRAMTIEEAKAYVPQLANAG